MNALSAVITELNGMRLRQKGSEKTENDSDDSVVLT